MLIGVVSDTHGHTEYALPAVRMLESLEVKQVLFCGDIGSAEIPPLFARWPTHFVFGNVDYNEAELRESIERAGLTCHGHFADLELGGRRIALLHSDDQKRFRATIDSGRYDLVCYGHTHVPRTEQIGHTLVLNPGALYRARTHTLATVDLKTMTPTFVPL